MISIRYDLIENIAIRQALLELEDRINKLLDKIKEIEK